MGVSPVFIVVRKRSLAVLFSCFFLCLAAALWHGSGPAASVFAAEVGPPVTVVIDPGHGGQDGGAVSADGVEESGLNLAVSQQVSDLLRLMGQRTVLTRTEDVMICDESLGTMRQRKVADIHNRVQMVNETENAILLSIHQNSLPSSRRTHGAQVFWNTQPGAEELAGTVQAALNSCINVGNEKLPKRIPSTIYLMKHCTAPAILVECGFLTNVEETRALQTPEHQRMLAAAITAGYLSAKEDP